MAVRHMPYVHPALGAPVPALDRPKELQTLRVLVDDADARALVAALLERCGSTVSLATSVREGLAVDRDSPQVIICDIGMPHQDGYDFVRQLRERPPARLGLASSPAGAWRVRPP